MKNYIEITYDSFCEYQFSKCPFRIIRYRFNSTESSLKFYKKQIEYNFDTSELENYIRKIHKKPIKNNSYKIVTNIISNYIGDERIVNYTLNKKVEELHFDKEDKEYYFSNNKLKDIIESKLNDYKKVDY